MWIAIGVSFLVQLVGLRPIHAMVSGHSIEVIAGKFWELSSETAVELSLAALVLAIIEKVRKKTPTKFSIILSVVLIALSLIESALSTFFATSWVGKKIYGIFCLLACIAALVLYIVFAIRAIKAIKNTALQNQYPCPPQYQNQDVSDEICVTTNGEQDQ